MKESYKIEFPFFKPLSLKNTSIILFGNLFLAFLGSCLLSTTKRDPSNHNNQIDQRYFEQPSTKLTLLISLAFPYDPTDKPKPLSLLDENKKTIVEKAFLLPQISNKERPLSLESNETRYLVTLPTKSLGALIPHLGKKLWGVPYVPKDLKVKEEKTQKNKKESYEISF